jgi:SAM-dependent methyltransferase
MHLRERVKWWLFPGINLHARLRYRVLPRAFGSARAGEERWVLVAGCGNGLLAYPAYLRGNRVLGISIKGGEVDRCRRLFNGYLGIAEDRLSFRVKNIHELDDLGFEPAEIVCSEVLEHIADDGAVCRRFHHLLKPGGVLHLCCPHAAHPDHRGKILDPDEGGGHVRAGYTFADYARLLEPIGFRVEARMGLGGPVRQAFNRLIIRAEERWGLPAAFAVFLFSLPFLRLDTATPPVPYSVYVRAVKP